MSGEPEDNLLLYDKIIKQGKRPHSKSDAIVNSRLIALFADRKLYARAIGCFYYIFDRIENLLESSSNDPRIQSYLQVSRPLFRSQSFQQDLEYFLGSSWKQDITAHSLLPTVQSYLKHLDALAHDPLLLIAHSFTQHLALASGGQVLKRIIRKGLALDDSDDGGTQIFEFNNDNSSSNGDGNDGYNKKKDTTAGLMYSRTLKKHIKDFINNEMKVTSEEEHKLIAEHQKVFELNNAIIKSYPTGIIAPLIAVLKLPFRSRRVVVWTASAVAVGGLAWYIMRQQSSTV